MSEMITLTIDGRQVRVPNGTTVYHAAKELGIDIPVFCYQDRMPPFGACRMCLVEVEKRGKLQASCTLEASEGMVVHTESEKAKKGREEIVELLLINHPLDCPICDRGGECPLQENAMRHGPGKSRFYEEKRHFEKPYPLGPVLMLDRERCIVCARCTRFSDEIAGDHALEFIDRGYKTEVGTPGGKPADSKFIGNTIMLCPVGALTSDVYRFRARPWDNESVNSTCTLCPVGCSMIFDSRDGEIVRTRSLEDKDVNDIWLCDKGWFGYEFVGNPERLQKPLIRKGERLQEASWEEAISHIADKMKKAKPGGKLAAFGGNPLTIEENYLLQKLMREGVGVNHLDHRIGMPIITPEEEGVFGGMEMAIGECEKLTQAFLFGLDLTEEFPVIWLRLRQAMNRGASVRFFGHYAPEIARCLKETVIHPPGDEMEHLLKIEEAAKSGESIALFVGRQYLFSKKRKAILSELLSLRKKFPNISLNIMEAHGNSLGARFAGMHPNFLPMGKKVEIPGLDAAQVLQTAAKEGWDFLYVAGANPAARMSATWRQARENIGFLVVNDLFLTETAETADVVLPVLSYAEKGGSFLNIERRIRKIKPGKALPNEICSDGEVFVRLAKELHMDLAIDPEFSRKLEKKRLPIEWPELDFSPAVPTEKPELSATFAPALFDRGVRMKHNPHALQLVKDFFLRIHPDEANKRGLADEERVTIKDLCVAAIRFDKSVAIGTVVVPLAIVSDASLFNGLPIEMTKEGSGDV